ncbi:hypothetical protein HAV21_04175 [Paenarthrobacter sp. MSM-2-10-13]|uniref:zinc-ribbon domain-containing protein n=1 Tax=Paenarthrobacter sp. MSM-2-10-13 TaxID=2717318 RepID=UPI00142103BF|nr:zinc-ribbon domain-containing protein [Paenarthrobacter sp. MSM-2-10-13]NHW46089.1 hypothetical protein [Paenarthrobacter sp. MSM-2-10-13]
MLGQATPRPARRSRGRRAQVHQRSLPFGSRARTVLQRIARFLALPFKNSDTETDLAAMLQAALPAVSTKLIVLDEVQMLANVASISRPAVNNLKDLTNYFEGTIVYSGLDLKDSELLQNDEGLQLKRRVFNVEVIDFTGKMTNKKTDEWAKIVAGFAAELPLYATSAELLGAEANWLHWFTGGNIGTLKAVLLDAAASLILEDKPGQETIAQGLLELSVRDYATETGKTNAAPSAPCRERPTGEDWAMPETEQTPTLPAALRIKAWPGETVYSFASRLERKLKATKRVINHLAYCDATRVLGKNATPRQTAERMISICEAMCVLPPGTLARVAPVNNRPFSSHLCSECVGGIAVEHEWNGGRYTCERHRRWIAPGPSPKKPSAIEPHSPGDYALTQLSQPVVDADLRIAELLAEGRISVALIDEVVRRIDSARGQEHWGIPRPCDLPVAAAALAALTDPDIHSIVLDETLSFAERYARLWTVLVDSGAALSPGLCDRLWLLLRQTIAWTRTTFFNEAPVDGFEPIIVPEPSLRLPLARYPLEPFRRSMACLRTAGTNADEWWQDRYMVVQSSPVEAPLLMCDNGHVQRTLKHHARRIEGEDFRCSICTGQRVVAGLNSLADLMSKIAADCDQAANGDLTPFMVTPGANVKVGWIDDNGHHYDAWIPNRTLQGTGCPFCAAKAVLAGLNDLTTTHPQLAAL